MMDYRELEKVKEALIMMEQGAKRKAARILLDLFIMSQMSLQSRTAA